MDELSRVYIRIDSGGRIIAVDGGYTIHNIKDFSDWILIDEGYGDRYNLCQSNYFPKPLITDGGAYCYKLVDRRISECTEEEIRMQEDERKPVPAPSTEERIAELEEQNAMLTECLLEISEILYS